MASLRHGSYLSALSINISGIAIIFIIITYVAFCLLFFCVLHVKCFTNIKLKLKCRLYTMHESRQIWQNHKSCIMYTQVIRIRFMPDLIRDLWFVNSQPLAIFARTIKGHQLDLHWFVCDAFISIHCLRILEDLLWKFLNSSRLINYQLIGLWLFMMVRRWVHKSWIWQSHE